MVKNDLLTDIESYEIKTVNITIVGTTPLIVSAWPAYRSHLHVRCRTCLDKISAVTGFKVTRCPFGCVPLDNGGCGCR